MIVSSMVVLVFFTSLDKNEMKIISTILAIKIDARIKTTKWIIGFWFK